MLYFEAMAVSHEQNATYVYSSTDKFHLYLHLDEAKIPFVRTFRRS
jgi:hypothetical protein